MVLSSLADGQTVKRAASALGISYKTACTHLYNLMRKLKVRNRAELLRCAVEHRLVVWRARSKAA